MTKDEFGERVTALQNSLYRIAYSYVRNEQDALDAVSEAILKAWQKRSSLRDESLFDRWLMRILIRECITLLRKRKRTVIAKEQGAKLTRVRAVMESVAVNSTVYENAMGQSWLPQADGTVLGTIEITDHLPQGEQYEMRLTLSTCEMTENGVELREEPTNTRLEKQWHVTIVPGKEGR